MNHMASSTSGTSSRLLCSVLTARRCLRQLLGCRTRAESHSVASAVSSVEQFTVLPECIQAQVLEFAGLQGSSSLGLACHALQREVWDNTEVWQARIASMESSAATS